MDYLIPYAAFRYTGARYGRHHRARGLAAHNNVDLSRTRFACFFHLVILYNYKIVICLSIINSIFTSGIHGQN